MHCLVCRWNGEVVRTTIGRPAVGFGDEAAAGGDEWAGAVVAEMNDEAGESAESVECGRAGEAASERNLPWRLINPLVVIVGGVVLGLSIPGFLSRVDTPRRPTQCRVNLRKIAQEMHIYAARSDGQFPTDFRALIESGQCRVTDFQCPSAASPSSDADSCYVYVPGQTTRSDYRNVLVYEKRGHHRDDFANVVFLDGHAESIKGYDNVLKLVRETEGRLAVTSAPTTVGETSRKAP